MRRSSRLYAKRQARLPLELQLLILSEAAADDIYPSKNGWKADVSNYALVSKAWQTEAQRALFSRIKSPYRLAFIIAKRPKLAQYFREVDCQFDDAVDDGPLAHIASLPNLRLIRRMLWPPSDCRRPEPGTKLPAPDYLSIEAEPGASSPMDLSPWLDLSCLRTLACDLRSPENEVNVKVLKGLLSPSLQKLQLERFRMQCFSDIVRALDGVGGSLKQLTLIPAIDEDVMPDLVANPLAFCPLLETLVIGHDDLTPIFAHEHTHLELLCLDATGCTCLGPSRDLMENIPTLCKTVAAHPMRFPSLRRVQVTSPCGFSFKSGEMRWRLDTLELARELQKVGLVLTDEHGTRWETRWELLTLSAPLRLYDSPSPHTDATDPGE